MFTVYILLSMIAYNDTVKYEKMKYDTMKVKQYNMIDINSTNVGNFKFELGA